MFANLTAVDIFNALLMQRQLDRRTFMLLEGISDVDALKPHVDAQHAECFEAGNKGKVVRVVQLANADGFKGLVGLVDRDFDGLVTPLVAEDNLIYTDDADLDSTMLFSGQVLQRLAQTYSSDLSRSSDLAASGETCADRIEALAMPLGVLRKVSIEERLEVDLAKFPLQVVVNSDGATVDVAKMCRIAKDKSPNCAVSVSQLVTKHGGEFPLAHPRRSYCRGHDLVIALHVCVKRWGGSMTAKREDIERIVRAAFARSDLETTKLYEDVRDWCAKHGRTVWA